MTPRQRSARFAATTAALRLQVRIAGMRAARQVDPQHRSIVVIDMADFGRRTDLAQLHARTSLDRVVNAAFRASEIAWHRLVNEDRGDGMIVFIPATVSKAVLLHPFLPQLITRLRDYNAQVGAGHRIRVRVAVHAGEVVHGPHGWIGTDLNFACRLVDSAPLYQALARQTQSDVAVAVSEVIHQAVVRHGHRGIDPASYKPVHVAVKEVATRAWIHVPAEHVSANNHGMSA
ncbi:hypothetical protein AB0F52_46025 [Amycolatopsis sp. NPDC024027]|uniref:hypothetical protein n=1 Tax=Amycolatopsis sp. NPDC024027 TaxID=3154327 RepID=UPI0033E2C953